MSKEEHGRPKDDEIHADALILTDSKGNYYVLPREHLQLSRVSEEAKPEVDKLLNRPNQRVDLGEGFSFVGFMTLPEEARWTHYSPDIAWPN